jgi:diguanylate cyclase (GGDEF)-like protein/PAS domain S-box-containing protein
LLAASLAMFADFGQRLEYEFADSAARSLMRKIDSDVVVVGIDAASLATLREWPWPRRHHASLIDRIAVARPSQLFIDIDFSSPSNPVDDGALEDALRDWPGSPVMLPAFSQYASASGDELVLTRPLGRFLRYVSLVSVTLRPDLDGLVRSVPMTDGDAQAPAALARFLHSEHRTHDERLWLDYTIDPSSFRYVSYRDVLANDIPAEVFAGRTVFVGAIALELGDTIPVPLHQSLPGVVVQALAYESARRGGHAALPQAVYWSLVAVWAALLAFWFCRQAWRRNVLALAASLALAAASALVAYAVFRTIVPIVPFGIAAIAAWLLATLRSLESETLRALAYALGLRRRDALLKSIVLSSTDSIVCVDGAGIIKTANPAAAALFRSRAEDLTGESIRRFVPSLAANSPTEAVSQFAGLADSVWECTGRTEDGDEFPVELSFSRVKLKDEQLYTAIIRDISERKRQQQQLQFQATHDPLTTLPNRPALAAHLDSLLAADERGERVSLLMIDLDRFKEVNDTLGHNVGDYVLYEVARRLEQTARSHGFIARIGGDEFALVVAGCDGSGEPGNLSTLSQDLVNCLRKPIETCGVAIDVGLSIGIATYPDDAKDAETLFKNADVAMYVAKRSASGFEYYDAGNDRHSVRKLTIATRLRQAVAEGRLELHYQPKVDLASGRVDGVEALIRWRDDQLGVVGPDEFIPLAESTDLIRPLSNWTLAEAFRQSAAWRARGIDLRIAVNVSARMLQDAAFPQRVGTLLREAGVAPERIELEITESAMMHDPKRAMQVIDGLAGLGVYISIDDYGTGYSSLAYLRDLPVHALKLDKSFVLGMRKNEGDRIIAASTAQMAHAMKLKVIAEGVESAADAALVRELGYDYAQGYCYSAALPAAAFETWLSQFHSARSAIIAATG